MYKLQLIDMDICIATKKDAIVVSENNRKMAKETENFDLKPDIAFNAASNMIGDESKGFYLLAKINGKVVGQLMITYEWSDWRNNTSWWIQSVYVDPLYRRKGIFKKLYESIQNKAKEQGIRLIRLYVHTHNQSAISVYDAIGLKQTSYFIYEKEI